MNINFRKFRIWNRIFRVLKVHERKEASKVQQITVIEEGSQIAKSFPMAVPFRIYEPERNLQILEDKNGNNLTPQQSAQMIENDKLNLY